MSPSSGAGFHVLKINRRFQRVHGHILRGRGDTAAFSEDLGTRPYSQRTWGHGRILRGLGLGTERERPLLGVRKHLATLSSRCRRAWRRDPRSCTWRGSHLSPIMCGRWLPNLGLAPHWGGGTGRGVVGVTRQAFCCHCDLWLTFIEHSLCAWQQPRHFTCTKM